MIEIYSAKLLTDRFKVEGKLYKWMIEGDTQPLPCCRFRHGLCGCAPWRRKNFESRRSLKINRVRTVRPGFIGKEVGVPLPNRLGKPWVLPLVGRSADERKKSTGARTFPSLVHSASEGGRTAFLLRPPWAGQRLQRDGESSGASNGTRALPGTALHEALLRAAVLKQTFAQRYEAMEGFQCKMRM